MKYIDPEPLDCAVDRLLVDIQVAADDGEPVAPDKLERLARAISIQLKAISDIDAHNQRVAKADEDKKYLNYDDLPPPSPEDRARLIERVRLLYDRVNAQDTVSTPDDDDDRASAGASD